MINILIDTLILHILSFAYITRPWRPQIPLTLLQYSPILVHHHQHHI